MGMPVNKGGIYLAGGQTASGSGGYTGFYVLQNNSASIVNALDVMAVASTMSFLDGTSIQGDLIFTPGSYIPVGLSKLVLSSSSAPVILLY